MTDTYEGSCFCGKVKLQVIGPSLAEGFCHCDNCRHWSATPVTAYALFPEDNVTITAGEEHLGFYDREGKARRVHCSVCGGSLMTEMPAVGLRDVYPPVLTGFSFAPQAHVYYAERMIDMADGLPKFKDMPEEAGGSGEMMDE